MEKAIDEIKKIKGWAADADPQNDPTYPMKNWTGDDHKRIRWQRPLQQPVNVEVLHSNERPSVSAVFGTAAPPSGLSGRLRRYAFRYSEGSYGHWLTLLLADRINVLEGIADDLKKGHVPNIFAERGLKAEWKYDRPALVKKVLAGAVVIAGAAFLLSRRRR